MEFNPNFTYMLQIAMAEDNVYHKEQWILFIRYLLKSYSSWMRRCVVSAIGTKKPAASIFSVSNLSILFCYSNITFSIYIIYWSRISQGTG
jgi:hypothetical protein